MKKIYLILAAVVGMTFASCTSTDLVGDMANNGQEAGDGSIQFGFNLQNTTRAGGDIAGSAAAEKLGGHFYVIGTKADMALVSPIPTGSPTTQLVFDNYSVSYTANTAGKTASNTANWEYVALPADAHHAKLSPNAQTIKFWDYSTTQYDFHAFSTGTKDAVTDKTTSTIGANEINVTKSLYGAGLAGGATAYTFIVPNAECLSNLYVTDITPVAKSNYGKDVQLKFKNLGAKIRIALYETVPGYSVQAGSVKFYDDATKTNDPAAGAGNYAIPTTTGTLISTAPKGMPTKGTIEVSFPNVGTSNSTNANYNKASVNVTADESAPANYEFTKTFGTIDQTEMVTAEAHENTAALSADQTLTAEQAAAVNAAIGTTYTTGQAISAADAAKYNVTISYYIGRSLPNASFVGDPNEDFYQLTFPVDDSHPLTLRVDYTLISTDGSGETITVHGAKAVVPSTYTKWQPNYAYTYIFKISDNTNGTTDYATEGLTAITFDAVVADFTDVSGEQRTITTVATPSITTYQQNHKDYASANEYDKSAAKNIYVQVKKADGSLAADLDGTVKDGTDRSILFSVPEGTTEAVVMDALQQRTTAIDADDVTGRNGVTLTKSTINNGCTSIEKGVDDKAITVAAGTTGEIAYTITAGTYAYVYDYSSGSVAKEVKDEFQPVAVGATVGESTKNYYPIAIDPDLKDIAVTGAEADVDPAYIYFSKTTTDGGTTYTYSYISVANKTKVPAGVVKLAKSVVAGKSTVAGSASPAANTFYFDRYYSNDGKYAVKVIKIID